MENLAPFFEQSLGDGFFNLQEQGSLLSDKEKNQFLQALSSSLYLSEMGKTIYEQLRTRLGMRSFKIDTGLERFAFGNKQEQENEKPFSLHSTGENPIWLSYGFDKPLSIREDQLLKEFHSCLRNPIKNALAFMQIKKLAMKDNLTGLGNRAHYDETLQKLISQAHRSGESLSLVVMDLDNFKPVNDKFGHAEGDKVLVGFAQELSGVLRSSDYAFRFGGDEFCCVLLNTDQVTNLAIIERLQTRFTNNELLNRRGISCSFGLAMLQPKDDHNSLFSRADANLYDAKANGKNGYSIKN